MSQVFKEVMSFVGQEKAAFWKGDDGKDKNRQVLS